MLLIVAIYLEINRTNIIKKLITIITDWYEVPGHNPGMDINKPIKTTYDLMKRKDFLRV